MLPIESHRVPSQSLQIEIDATVRAFDELGQDYEAELVEAFRERLSLLSTQPTRIRSRGARDLLSLTELQETVVLSLSTLGLLCITLLLVLEQMRGAVLASGFVISVILAVLWGRTPSAPDSRDRSLG